MQEFYTKQGMCSPDAAQLALIFSRYRQPWI
jgi:hypothetical protein